MAESTNRGCRESSEFVLGSLNDDSDEEMDEEPEAGDKETDYEEKTLEEISVIKGDVKKMEEEIKLTSTEEKGKYDKYAEYLLQTIIKLDNIDTKNNENIREARKRAILYAQNCLQVLDSKLNSLLSSGETTIKQ